MIAFTALTGLAAVVAPRPARAQLATNEQWHTIRTPHFRVHFTTASEPVGRRAATAAERAYANLARELVPPRGVIDVIIADAADISNGSAGVFPRNRVIINARPPVDQTSLENYDDWLALVLQHEVTHIFHLDRTRGWWRAAQYLFGRNPVLFPAYYAPSWVTEGLAVYYESRFTPGGRLQGSYADVIARSAAIDHGVPRLSQLSLASSRYPYGQASYIYGAFLLDRMAQRGGDAGVRRFIEAASAQPVPFFLNRAARDAFGVSFTREWARWRDSLAASVATGPAGDAGGGPVTGGRDDGRIIPGGGRYIIHPRWRDDSIVAYAADVGRESPGLYETPLAGPPRRVDRRTSLDANAVSPSGDVLFAQSDFVDRLHNFSDLYVTRRGVTRRLTTGARLSAPDWRADGEIVAVRTIPGTTILARVSHDGHVVRALTPAAPDTQWAAPRWSPDGTRIAAVRLTTGTSEVVVLDTLGRVLATAGLGRAVTRSPAWRADGAGVYFTSDRTGVSEVYYAALPAAAAPTSSPPSLDVTRVTSSTTGLFYVDASDNTTPRLTSTVLHVDGFHVVTLSPRTLGTVPGADTAAAVLHTVAAGIRPWLPAPDTSPLQAYSPWRALLPSYWSPVFQSGSSTGALVGGLTSGSDPIGRHSYALQASLNMRTSLTDVSAVYRYARFVNPVLSFSADQSWSYFDVTSGSPTTVVGELRRVKRVYAADATFERPRAFTYASLTLGAELETRDYETDPTPLRGQLSSFFARQHRFPAVHLGAQFSNAQRPTLSISPEDGVTLSMELRRREESGVANSAALSAVGVTSLYKSLDLPGFAHHVLALRLAGGTVGTQSTTEFSVGGVNGGALDVIPGVTLGDQGRTFPVRGFEPGTQVGIRAATASLEYRLPLTIPSHGFGGFPIFLDRTSLALFADAGAASCPRALLGADSTGPVSLSPACTLASFDQDPIVSAGAELNLDTALQFDVPYRFRLGFAAPIRGREQSGAKSASIYVTLGGSF